MLLVWCGVVWTRSDIQESAGSRPNVSLSQCLSLQYRMEPHTWQLVAVVTVLVTLGERGEGRGQVCQVVRSPYPVSDSCFPVPECQHKCQTVQEQVCDVRQRKKCGYVTDKKCKTVFETECRTVTERDCHVVHHRECTTGKSCSFNIM